MIDKALSQQLADAVEAEPGECWRNAIMALFQVNDAGARYVEGWAAGPEFPFCYIPMEHGWIEMSDGTVIDPTWITLSRTLDDYVYAPFRYYTRGDIDQLLAEKGEIFTPLFFHYGTREDRNAFRKTSQMCENELLERIAD